MRARSKGAWALVDQRLDSEGLDETMWLPNRSARDAELPSRVATASLTPRETEVLTWVPKGKTNRDVAEILAAAALASRELG